MNALRELLGLFVDDGSLAVGILAIVALAGLVLPLLALPPVANAAILLAACLGLLFVNVVRRARR